jgi:hypothetical protein
MTPEVGCVVRTVRMLRSHVTGCTASHCTTTGTAATTADIRADSDAYIPTGCGRHCLRHIVALSACLSASSIQPVGVVFGAVSHGTGQYHCWG